MKNVLILFFLCLSFQALSQDDMMAALDEPTEKPLTRGTFKGTRLVNMHTTEIYGKGSLDFRISHRFADFSNGGYGFWGLDGPANLQLRLDYSVLDNLAIGFGRTSTDKLYDAFVKWKFVKQRDGGTPLSMVLFSSINMTGMKDANASSTGKDKYEVWQNRLSYCTELMISRKFTDRLSLQLTPIYVHYNLVPRSTDKNDVFALGISGRYKFSKRMAVTTEYIPTINKYAADMSEYFNSFSIGVDIETGGHVFQLFVTNSYGINEVQYIANTTSSWEAGEIRLGFNVSRVFSIGGKKQNW